MEVGVRVISKALMDGWLHGDEADGLAELGLEAGFLDG